MVSLRDVLYLYIAYGSLPVPKWSIVVRVMLRVRVSVRLLAFARVE